MSTNKNKAEALKALLKDISHLAERGLSLNQIADFFEYTDSEWEDLVSTNPEIIKHFRKGRAKTTKMIADQLIAKIRDGDLKAMTFFLSNVCGYDNEKFQRDKLQSSFNKQNKSDLGSDPIEAAKVYERIMRGDT